MNRIVEIAPDGSQRDRPGGRDADGARARGRRARALLPGRSRRGRDARRHGRDERGRDDDDPLREDARQHPRARGRARRRDDHPDGQPGAEDLGRLRPDEPARRLRGDARGDHRGARPALRHPGARRRAAHLLPDGRRGLPDGRRGRRRRLGRHAARAARRLDARGDQRLPRLELSGGPVPARRGGGNGGDGRGRPRARARAGRGGGRHRDRRRARPDRPRQALGRPARRGVRGGRRLAADGTSARPTPASPSPSWPAPSRSPAPRWSASASTRPSSATPATATSTSACSSTPTTRPRWRSPTSSSSGWSSTRSRAAAPARASTASAMGKIAALELEHGDLVPLMREIKRVFDPHGIMNPGKVFTTPAGALSSRRRGQLYIAAAAVAWSTAGGLQRELSVDTPTQLAGRALLRLPRAGRLRRDQEPPPHDHGFRSMGIAGLGVAICTAIASGIVHRRAEPRVGRERPLHAGRLPRSPRRCSPGSRSASRSRGEPESRWWSPWWAWA